MRILQPVYGGRHPTRPGPAVAQIAQSILAELARSGGAKVKVRIDIEAEQPAGFSEDVVEVVRANARAVLTDHRASDAEARGSLKPKSW